MSELLVRIKDKEVGVGVDPKQVSQRGHVIAVCPDGWAWSNAERTNPEWMIVKAPLLKTHIDQLLASPTTSPAVPSSGRRLFALNLDLLAIPTNRTLEQKTFTRKNLQDVTVSL